MSREILHLCRPRAPKKKPQSQSQPEPGSTEYWQEHREASQQRRESNRKSSAERLTEAGIEFETRKGGAHLIVKFDAGFIDFWPGTGLWVPRNTKRKSRGVRKLIAYINGAQS